MEWLMRREEAIAEQLRLPAVLSNSPTEVPTSKPTVAGPASRPSPAAVIALRYLADQTKAQSAAGCSSREVNMRLAISGKALPLCK
jgi:hypothetical protein